MLRRVLCVIVMGTAVPCLASCTEVHTSTNNDVAASSGGMGGAGNGGMTSSSSGDGGTGGGSFCANVPFVEWGGSIDGNLAVTGQQDFYAFKGKQGQVVSIDIDAQYFNGTGFDLTVIDSVLTLYDDEGNQIAQNDDPIEYATNDSRLYTILPESRNYCVRVSECWSNPDFTCGGSKDKLVTNYSLWLSKFMDGPGDNVTAEVENGDTPATSSEIDYALNADGHYMATFWGTYEDATDVDVFAFTLPNDVALPANTRAVGYFFFMPTGPNENGSTATLGNMWVTEAATPDKMLARVDANLDATFGPRLELGKSYLLFVTRAPATPLDNDFYFVRHYLWPTAPLELEQGSGQNDTPQTAETIAVNAQTNHARIEGDIVAAPADVDHFRIAVPPGMSQVRAFCSAREIGSGLIDLKLSLLGASGNLLSTTSWDVDDASSPAQVPNVPVAGNAEVFLEVTASSQQLEVAATFYSCSLTFVP